MNELKPEDETVIGLLSDGRFHSGEELGAVLGLSRAAIWKRLKRLEHLGLRPESVRGKGYRLPGGLSLLQKSEVMVHGEGRAPVLHIRAVTGSTNQDALALAEQADEFPFAVLAEFQSAGRGRRGRSWYSPFGAALYLSYVDRFHGGASALEGLSLAVGIAVADALTRLGVQQVGLKWPNDVQVAGRKVAGILIELSGDFDGTCTPVIGVGLNVHLPDVADVSIDQPWTDVARALGTVPDRNRIAGLLLSSLADMLDEFKEWGFGVFSERWAAYDVCRGRPVQVHLGQQVEEGVACGVTPHGALQVDIGGVRKTFHGGEVSLRVG